MADVLIDQPGLRVVEGGRHAQLVLHCDPDHAPAIEVRAGVPLAAAMLRVEANDTWRSLHLAPDEWLLIGPIADRDATIARIDATPEPHSLVDVGERSLHLRIEGAAAATLLNSACPLDLSNRAFAPNACARTLFGKAPVMLERAQDCFRMHYARSFRDYVIGLARTAAQDLPGHPPI